MNQYKITLLSTRIFTAVTVGLFALLAIIWTVAVDLTTALALATFVTLPAAIVGWFVLSLVLYRRSKRLGDKETPALKARLRTATVLLVFLAVVCALLVAFFAMAIGHM